MKLDKVINEIRKYLSFYLAHKPLSTVAGLRYFF